jgi:hypothetical protein
MPEVLRMFGEVARKNAFHWGSSLHAAGVGGLEIEG